MNYNTIAHDILFRLTEDTNWEKWPYKKSNKRAGIDSDMRRIQYIELENGPVKALKDLPIPKDYVKLDICDKVHALGISTLIDTCGHAIPDRDTVGKALIDHLRKREIVNFITEEDWGRDLFFTIEAIYVTKEDYHTKIQPKIIKVAQKQLGEAQKRKNEEAKQPSSKRRKSSRPV